MTVPFREYTISAGCVLAPIGSIPSGGSNPHSLVISPGGFLYCANVNLQLVSDVSEFSINSSTGALTLINTYTVGLEEPLDTGALWISFDPTGVMAWFRKLTCGFRCEPNNVIRELCGWRISILYSVP
jgi:hypothetical protein